MSVHVDDKDLGKLFVDGDGNGWIMVSYCDRPQATFERVDNRGERVTHVVGCINYCDMGLHRANLVPVEESAR